MTDLDLQTGAQLLADILASPEDDAPRLIYADWLEEYGGRPERAELIRLQIAMWNGPYPADGWGRETELLANRWPVIFPELSGWTACWSSEFAAGWREVMLSGDRKARVSRGFIESVELRLIDWQAVGEDVTAADPMLHVHLTDREPNGLGGWSHTAWYWYDDGTPGEHLSGHSLACCSLPYEIWSLLAGAVTHTPAWKEYPSKKAAEDAASDALLLWAQKCRNARRGESDEP